MKNWFENNKAVLELALIAFLIVLFMQIFNSMWGCQKEYVEPRSNSESHKPETPADTLRDLGAMSRPITSDKEIIEDKNTDNSGVPLRLGNSLSTASWERGMYLDRTNTIYNVTTERNKFSKYCKKFGFTRVYMYSTSSFLGSSSTYSAFATFMKQLNDSGVVRRAIATGDPNSVNSTGYITKYNNSQTDPVKKVNTVNYEKEFWNGATSWSNWINELKGFSQGTVANNDFYIGWFKNLSVVDSVAAREMVRYSDRILLHCYQTTAATYSYANAKATGNTAGRLDLIAKGARALNKPIDLWIIMSSEDIACGASYTFQGPLLKSYRLSTNPFYEVEKIAYADITSKMTVFQSQWINFRGFIWFTYRYNQCNVPFN